MNSVIILSPHDLDNLGYDSIIINTLTLLETPYILLPTAIISRRKELVKIDKITYDYPELIETILSKKYSRIIYNIDSFVHDKEFIDAINDLFIKYKDVIKITSLEYYTYWGKPVHELIKIDPYEYVMDNAINTSVLVLHPDYVEILSGSGIEHIDLYISVLKELSKEIGVTNHVYSYYVTTHGIYLVGIDLRRDVVVKKEMIEETIRSRPIILTIYSSVMSKTSHIFGLTYLIGAVASSLIHGSEKMPNIEDIIKELIDIISSSIQYWKTLKRDREEYIYPNPLKYLRVQASRYDALTLLKQALRIITENNDVFYKYIQSTGSNLLQSIKPEYVRSIYDIASPHRIFKGPQGEIIVVGEPDFGMSRFLSKILYTVMRVNTRVTSLMSITYSNTLLELATRMHIPCIMIELKAGKKRILKLDEMIEDAIINILPKVKNVEPPIMIYHEGTIGLEPAIYILDKDAVKLVSRIMEFDKIIRSL